MIHGGMTVQQTSAVRTDVVCIPSTASPCKQLRAVYWILMLASTSKSWCWQKQGSKHAHSAMHWPFTCSLVWLHLVSGWGL